MTIFIKITFLVYFHTYNMARVTSSVRRAVTAMYLEILIAFITQGGHL